MPYNRPAEGVYVVRAPGDPALNHDKPVRKSNFVGVSVKQKATHWDAGLATSSVIADNEQYFIVTRGIVQVDDPGGLSKGDPVYITAANVLTGTATGNTKFGRVVEVVGDGRGVPTGKIRINLDGKDSF